MEVFVVANFGLLRPATDEDAQKLKGCQDGQTYRIKLSRPRNIQFHRKYFALLGLVCDNLPEDFALIAPDGTRIAVHGVEDILWHIKMQLGHYEKKITMGGKVLYEAKSINFASMDDHDFQKFYSGSIDVVLKYFLVGAQREALEEAVIVDFS